MFAASSAAPSAPHVARYGYRKPLGKNEVKQGPVITALPAMSDDRALCRSSARRSRSRSSLPPDRSPDARIRKALSILASEGELDHPLVSRQLSTDGRDRSLRLRPQRGRQAALAAHRCPHPAAGVPRRDPSPARRHQFDDRWATELILPCDRATGASCGCRRCREASPSSFAVARRSTRSARVCWPASRSRRSLPTTTYPSRTSRTPSGAVWPQRTRPERDHRSSSSSIVG